MFLPVEIRGSQSFNLLAVWAFNHRAESAEPSDKAHTRTAITHYGTFLTQWASIVAGDFNSSVVWDRDGKPNNFASLASDLSALGLVSAYHMKNGCEFGQEPQPTLLWRRSLEQTYHIDYCFVPQSWMSRITALNVGEASEWVQHSDHAPLIVDIDIPEDQTV